MFEKENGDYDYKLGEFNYRNAMQMNTLKPEWIPSLAPELLKEVVKPTSKGDTWAMGIIYHRMIF